MKRFACVCGGLAVLVAAQSATAQLTTTNNGLTIFYDVRQTVPEITVAPVAPFDRGQSLWMRLIGKNNAIPNVAAGNAGGPGDAQVLRLSPRLPVDDTIVGTSTFRLAHVNRKTGKAVVLVDASVKHLYAYITVEASGAGTEQVISALGRDTDVLKVGGANGNKLESIAITPNTGEWSAAGTSPAPGTLATQVVEDFFLSAKSVKIPVVAAPGPTYDATGGAIPAGTYRVACYTVTAGPWNRGNSLPANSTYEGRDEVNNLLMTRAVKTLGPAPVELPDFGYTTINVGDVEGRITDPPGPPPGAPDGDADFVVGSNGGLPEASNANDITALAFTGADIGASSIEADFEIIIQSKGDFNDDGTVTGADVANFAIAVLADAAFLRQRGKWLGDFNVDGFVTGGDVAQFAASLRAHTKDCTTTPAVDCIPCVGCSEVGLPTCP